MFSVMGRHLSPMTAGILILLMVSALSLDLQFERLPSQMPPITWSHWVEKATIVDSSAPFAKRDDAA